MNRADTQDHPLLPNFKKSPGDKIGPNFLVTVAFVPPVVLAAHPAQKDHVVVKQTFSDLPDASSLPCRLSCCHSHRDAWTP